MKTCPGSRLSRFFFQSHSLLDMLLSPTNSILSSLCPVPSQDHLVSFCLLIILKGQGHISKVVVLSQVSQSSTLPLIFTEYFISWFILHIHILHRLSAANTYLRDLRLASQGVQNPASSRLCHEGRPLSAPASPSWLLPPASFPSLFVSLPLLHHHLAVPADPEEALPAPSKFQIHKATS